MARFVFRFLCVFYVIVVANTRTLYNNVHNCGKLGDIFGFRSRNDTTEPKNNEKREAKLTNNEMDKILANVTEKVNHLKEKYGQDRYETLLPKLDKIIYGYSTHKTTTRSTTVAATEDVDFLGTAQIEELLNDIKARAIEMVAEQNPSVTDIITNTVTEATFEADPILTHLDISSPGYALTTFVCLNNMENIDKRTANDSNVILISNKDSKHNVSARSVKEDAYTIAQNVEDMLQKELKSIYKKVKNKVSKDFHKEAKKAKSTLKCESSKIIDKVTKKVTGAMKTTNRKATTVSRHNRGNKSTKQMTKSTKLKEDTTATPTVDDFAMLTLYEQILAKTHEDNVMKMLTTNKKRKIDEHIRLSIRNPETLADLTLKEDVKRNYDYGESIPDIDYNNDIIIPETSNDYSSVTNPTTTKSSEITHTTEGEPVEDTSYEGLSDKISYKDYVNGYKSYLKFQKDQAKQNFSALVKYQAHRHHKVDDIGKFILNKIPQIPNRKRRHFFDDSDIDEQDISTKSDESWFKKHFYMFIDNGPPKKYHTSETVEFKDVTESNRASYTDSIERPGLRVSSGPEVDRKSMAKEHTPDINLDELSKVLEDSKATASGVPPLNNDYNIDTTPSSEQNKVEESGIAFKVYAPNIISKFFGKGRRNPVKDSQKYDDNTLKYDEDNFLFNSNLERYKRHATKQVKVIEKEVNKKLTLTTLNKQDNAKLDKKKSNNEKVGCVSVVTQPTAIVNLHETNVKGSKIQKLLSRLHFHKKNKKKMKEKRHCTRVQRFNPLKKLKDMFMPRPNEREMVRNNNAPADYDMITSHIDTFKPVKYDKIPSVDELRNQVPNISGDIATSQPEKMDVAKPDNEWAVKDYTKKMNKILADIDTNVATKSFPVVQSSRSFQPTPKKLSKTPYSTQKISTNEMLKNEFDVVDDVMNVKVKTLPKMDDTYTISPVTLDGTRNEIDKLQIKLSTDETLTATPKLKVKEKTYDNTHSADDKEFNDDITIKAKLTRIAKYPISKLKSKYNNSEINSVGDNSKLYEFADDDGYPSVHEEFYPNPVSEKRTPFFEIQYSTKDSSKVISLSPPIDITLKNLDSVKELPIDVLTNNKRYPDYFHDLVIWNSDILNYDKVSNPTWQDILKDIKNVQEFTTPNVRNMENELNEMNNIIANEISRLDDRGVTFKAIAEPISQVVPSLRYVAKADNIKVAVENNYMGNYTTIEDIDEATHYLLRNDSKKYFNSKSQDIIDVLNKLYTKQPYEVETRANTLRAISKWNSNKGPTIINDTNRADSGFWNYVGDQSFVTDSWFPKKISKNSLKSINHKNKDTHTITKVNKQPKQFYNTPLPMKNDQFEKFLKENRLDVESLTLPINEMPIITETWHSKITPLTNTINFNKNINSKTTFKNRKTAIKLTDNKETTKLGYSNTIEEDIDKSYPENQIEYLNDLEQDLFDEYRNNVNIRQKRSSIHDYDTFTDNALIGKEKIEKIKSKLNNIFDKKPEGSTEMMNLNSVSNPNENEVEITIINFDDTDKMGNDKLVTNPNAQVLVKVNSTVKDDTKTLTNVNSLDPTKNQKASSKTEKETEKLLHNRNLLIKEDVNETGFNSDAQISLKDFKEKQTSSEMKDGIAPINLMQLPDELSEKYMDKQGNLPKRVQISSHSYKYDVLYNVPSKMKTADEQSNQDEKEGNIDIKRFSDRSEKESINSEIHQIINVVDVVKAVEDYTRPDFPIHINLPTYYAPNTSADNTELLPANLKTSWTDLVLKYISGIALIEMLNKLGVLKGGINLTDGLNLNFDRDKVFSKDGVMDHVRKLRVERAAKTTKKRYTFSQMLHFTREMKRPRNKRLFKLLPIKDKLKLFARNKSRISTMKVTKKKLTSKTLKVNATTTMKTTDEKVATKGACTKRNERGSKQTNEKCYDIFDYKGDIDEKKDGNIKTDEITINPIFIITKEQDKIRNKKKYKDGVYAEDAEYNDQDDYETASKATTHQTYIKANTEKDIDFNAYNKLKRDVSHETFTAKDVAALEVIVDLMKNTMGYGEKSPIKMFSHNNFIAAQRTTPKKNTNEKMEHITNSIQVHIAIPYDVPDKKRSLDPLKVRKVFTAKMATPVDLEYQIHSIEDSTATTAVSPDLDYGISPGMYLLVDDANTLKGSFALKPVKPPSVHMRKIDEEKLDDPTKINKVTLSKDFVAAVNKHLIQLYENITAANNITQSKHKVTRRETSWYRIKKYFGHDRVCNCKCKTNKTMCRACAASDAVIKELTFEFDNLAKYMSDHCTEIQTFFWMNPSGGRILRDSVHKIDKSLNNYYKRVKGKCCGRTCKTFATYIDKRDFDKNMKVAKTYTEESLINDLKTLNDNFDVSLNFIPYDETLKEKGNQLVKTASKCIDSKIISKRSSLNNKIKQNYDKEVYTLDNISVNIICSPEASSESIFTSPLSLTETSVTDGDNILLDYDFNKRNCKKNKFKNLFSKKNKPKLSKPLIYYETHVTSADTFKREVKYDQVESPLIADTGGSFWLEYLSKGNVDVSNDNIKPNVEISVIQKNIKETPVTTTTVKSNESFKDKVKNICKSKIKATVATGNSQLVTDAPIDSLSYNINELFKLIGTIKDVEEIKNTYTDATTTVFTKYSRKHKTKKIKTKKRKKIHKTTKAKVHHHKHKTKTTKMTIDIPTNTYNTTSAIHTDSSTELKEKKTTTEVPKTTEPTFDSFTVDEITATLQTNTHTKQAHKATTTKKNLFNKIKMATLGFLSNIGKGNCVLDQKTTRAETEDDRQIRTANVNIKDFTTDNKKPGKVDINVLSEATTKMNPTILIINDESTINDFTKDSKSKYKSILLSLLNYESGKLDKERQRISNGFEKEIDVAGLVENFTQDVDDIEHTLMGLKMQPKSSKASHQDIDYDILKSLKTIGPELELPAPPGLQSQPGMLEKMAHQFGIKVVQEKVAASPVLKTTKHYLRITKGMKSKRRLSGFEEAEPTEIPNLEVQNNKRSIDRKYKEVEDHTSRQIETDLSNERTFSRTATINTKIKYRKAEFDSYVREDNGIYRLRRNEPKEVTSFRITESVRSKDSAVPKVRNTRSGYRRKQRKRKRSNDGIKHEGLDMWLQHTTGYFLVTATCFYIVFALFAIVVNWLFRR